MTRRSMSAAIAFVWVAQLAAVPAPPQDPTPTYRASADSVGVDVSVRRNGRAVAGLTAADFVVLDNGVAQQVTGVIYEKLPIDVAVALDVSSSVTGAVLDQLRQAVRELEAGLAPQDRLKLIGFNMRVALLADFAPAASHASSELDGLIGGGSSSIFDAVAVALSTPVPADRRQMVVLFTDGDDSSSITSAATLLEVARRTTPTVFVVLSAPPAVLLGKPVVTAREAAMQQVYLRLATETGGALTSLARDATLSSTFRRSLDEFRASYVLHFAPTGVARQGAHTLSVRINRPGPFDVRARAGYVWR